MAMVKSFLEKVKTKVPSWLALKKPWEFTGPCSDPEYEDAVPNALDYRPFSPATAPVRVHVPASQPETVYDIKYYTRDRRRNLKFTQRKKYILDKSQLLALRESKPGFFETHGFPTAYPNKMTELDEDKRPGSGYV